MADGATLSTMDNNSVIDPELLKLDNRAADTQNESSATLTSDYLYGDMEVEHRGGASYGHGSALYEQLPSPTSQLTTGQPYPIAISRAAATQVDVRLDSSRNEFVLRANAECTHPENPAPTDSDDNGDLSLVQSNRAKRTFAKGQINCFKSGTPLTQELAVLQKLEQNQGLYELALWILKSPWYRKREKEEAPDASMRQYMYRGRVAEASSSPFSAFFTHDPPYVCLLCDKPANRTLVRALGHARGHFGFKIDEKYTNCNTRNDQIRRNEKPNRKCPECPKIITVQNMSRHRLTQHGVQPTKRPSKATNYKA